MQVQRGPRELWFSFIAILAITVVYIFMVTWLNAIPKASDFFGHSIGILGFLLMLMTETLYSLRKRRRSARWGAMSQWLDFHIFTGLVGPYLVLLHSSWKFNGLAGIVLLMTLIIVASGFVGRYIYTAIPRTREGVEIEAQVLEIEIGKIDSQLQDWLSIQRDESIRKLAQRFTAQSAVTGVGYGLVVARGISERGHRLGWWLEKRRLSPKVRAQLDQMSRLLRQKRTLQRQVASLAMARRLMALWHAVHVPLGLALFILAFIHILAAIYYATLLR